MSTYATPSRDGIYTVTPAQAKFWLENHAHPRNRTWRYSGAKGDHYPTTVRLYRREMEQGRWRVTNASIGFSSSGLLIDGHNRLMACVLANVPIETRVAVNVPDSSFEVIDIGKSRTASNLLSPDFGNASSMVISTVRLQDRYEKDGLTDRSALRPDRIYEYVLPGGKFERIGRIAPDLYHEIRSTKVKLPFPAHIVAFVRYNTEQYGMLSDDWCRGAMYGTGLADGHPVLALRNQAFGHVMNHGKPMDRDSATVFAIRSWNLMAEGKPAPARYLNRNKKNGSRVKFPKFKEPK